MAKALGFVTKHENGDYKGTLSLMTLKDHIKITPNAAKSNDRQPDFRVSTRTLGDIGGGWNRVGKTSGKPYISLTLADPALGPSKLYANLGRAAGQEDEAVFAILWNPMS